MDMENKEPLTIVDIIQHDQMLMRFEQLPSNARGFKKWWIKYKQKRENEAMIIRFYETFGENNDKS